jgi:hypothetical protein
LVTKLSNLWDITPLASVVECSEFLAASHRYPGFGSRRYQIFCIAVGLERSQLSLVRINEELCERKSSGSGIEN